MKRQNQPSTSKEPQRLDRAAMLPPAAQRALAEAAERRAQREAEADRPAEIAGRGGAEPVRYGDWEVKGLAVDF